MWISVIFLHAIHVAFWLYKVMCFVFVFFFYQVWEVFIQNFFFKKWGGHFFWIFFCGSMTHLLVCWMLSHRSLSPCWFFLLFRVDHFYWSTLKFTEFFLFAISNLQLSPLNEHLISLTVLFNYRCPLGSFFIISIFLWFCTSHCHHPFLKGFLHGFI